MLVLEYQNKDVEYLLRTITYIPNLCTVCNSNSLLYTFLEKESIVYC